MKFNNETLVLFLRSPQELGCVSRFILFVFYTYRMSSLGSNTTAAAFIGASVTLVLVLIFMVLMVILVRQCLAFMAKRTALRQQTEQHRRQRADLERQRRLSVTEPVTPTFNWHHSIRIAGTPPPTYHEAKKLPTYEDENIEVKGSPEKKNEIDISRHDGESELSIQIDNISITNITDTAVGEGNLTDNEDSSADNRAASMAAVNSETVIEVESESTAGGHNPIVV